MSNDPKTMFFIPKTYISRKNSNKLLLNGRMYNYFHALQKKLINELISCFACEENIIKIIIIKFEKH